MTNLRQIFQVSEGRVDVVLSNLSVDVCQILVDVFKERVGNSGGSTIRVEGENLANDLHCVGYVLKIFEILE